MQYEAQYGSRKTDRGNLRASEGTGTTTLDLYATGANIGNANPWQVFNLSNTRTVVLPTVDVRYGDKVLIVNRGQRLQHGRHN